MKARLRVALVYGGSIIADAVALHIPIPVVAAGVALLGVAACWVVSR